MPKICTTDRTLLALLARALFGVPFVREQDADFHKIFEAAWRHMVFGVAGDGLADLPQDAVPLSDLRLWQSSTVTLMRRNTELLELQGWLVSFLQSEGIPYAILKGASVARLYPAPELRVCGDIDCLVAKNDLTRVADFLTQNGFARENSEETHHIAYKRGDAEIELHFAVSGLPQGAAGDALARFFADTLETAVPATLAGREFRIPAPCHQGLILLLHMIHHIKDGGIGLRQVLDWAMFIESGTNAASRTALGTLCATHGLLTFASTLTRLCVRYLGLSAECATWCEAVDDALCDALLADFLACGNFGQGAGAYTGSGIVTKDRKAGESAFRAALRGVATKCRAEWSVADRHPFLLVFLVPFWIIRRPFRRDEVRVHPIRMMLTARRRTKLLDKLAPFEIK